MSAICLLRLAQPIARERRIADRSRLPHKTVRIVTDRALRDQLNSLIGYGRPLQIEGSVTDEVSPLLMVQDILPPKEAVAEKVPERWKLARHIRTRSGDRSSVHLLFLIKLYRDNCGRRRTTPAIVMTAAKANTTAASGATSDKVA